MCLNVFCTKTYEIIIDKTVKKVKIHIQCTQTYENGEWSDFCESGIS